MGKKRSQNEAEMKKTMQKLVQQRDEARRIKDEVLGNNYVAKSEHRRVIDTMQQTYDAITDALRAQLAAATFNVKQLEQAARDGNRHVYAELDLARETVRDLQEAVKAKSEALGGEMFRIKQLQDALADNEERREHQRRLIVALEKRLTEESAEAARATRKRLEKKTAFIREQQTYVHHLETTLKLFARLPAVQNYLSHLKEAKANGTLKVSRTSTAVLEAETIESRRPVEVES
jgi:hypothetical protein